MLLGTTDICSYIGSRKNQSPGSAEKNMAFRKQYIETCVTGEANVDLLLWIGSTIQ